MTDPLKDILRRASKTGGPCFTHFLDPASGREFLGAAKGAGLEGGSEGAAPDAERAVYACWGQGFASDNYPVRALCAKWSKLSGRPGHRDLLGAVLGMGISRDCVGDIRVGDCEAWLAVEEGVAAYIQANLVQAGRVTLSVEPAQRPLPRARGAERAINVQSLRVDAVLAAALDLSRAKAQELIRAGRVNLNWHEEVRPDREVLVGDTLSIRGRGRIRIGETSGVSRKGRSRVTVETFLGNDVS